MSRDRWGQRVARPARTCSAGHSLVGPVTTSADGRTEIRECEEEGCWASPNEAPALFYCRPSEATEEIR